MHCCHGKLLPQTNLITHNKCHSEQRSLYLQRQLYLAFKELSLPRLFNPLDGEFEIV